MTYQVLARKWRPQDFSSIVGQEPIVTALRNALADQRIAQAYLFSGIRGVGKTTAARVLAKALNCENGPAADPCNECDTCRDITGGQDMDVIEVDAATYSKVEQVRELTESLRYGPARNRYKVVVLDEVHRLSRQAFDALLKIVEEPPDHLVFVFATTEIDAVPATILSRCQEFQFRRVSSASLTQHLRHISEAENIETSDAALRWIARAGEGSVRDSVALLDQLATFGAGRIDEADAKRLLGGLDTEVFSLLLTSILGGDAQRIRELTHEIEQNGWDPNHVYGQFLLYTRDALHLSLGGAIDAVDLPGDEAKHLAKLVASSRYEDLLRLVQLLLSSEPTVRRSEFGHLALELTWLRAAQLPKLTRVEELLTGGPGKGSGSTTISAPRPSTHPKEVRSSRRATAPPAIATDTSEPASDNATFRPGSLQSFLDRLRKRPPLAAHFRLDRLHFEDGELRISTPAGDTLLEEALRLPANAEFLGDALSSTFGPSTAWKIIPAPPSEAPSQTAPTRSTMPSAAPPQRAELGRPRAGLRTDENPVVQAVLDIFNGTVQATLPGTRENHST